VSVQRNQFRQLSFFIILCVFCFLKTKADNHDGKMENPSLENSPCSVALSPRNHPGGLKGIPNNKYICGVSAPTQVQQKWRGKLKKP
jgi:hypothetical protein